MAKTVVFNEVPDLMRVLKGLDKEASAELRGEAFEIAADIAKVAASSARSQGGLPALIAPGITGRRDRVPTVKMGGSRKLPPRVNAQGEPVKRKGANQNVGDAMWGAEFGGQRRPTTQQFRPWRGSGSGAGYFLYPAVRELADDMQDRYGDALLRAIDASARRGKR